MSALTPRPGIMKIAPYVPGKDSVEGRKTVAKLSSNEGALGPSPRAMAAYAKAAAELHRYPDGDSNSLRAAIGRHYGLDAKRIICGAGSDELLNLLIRAYCGPGDELLHSQFGFLMYAINALGAGATPVAAPESDYRCDVDAMLGKVTNKTRVVCLANPNNPTGTYIPFKDVRRLHEGLRSDILLVLDAAYAEYVRRNDYESGIELAGSARNVVMTRTFSKIYGLAALRIGWGYGPPEVIDVLNRIRGPFNVSSAAIAAGVAALADRAHRDKAAAHNETWLPRLVAAIERLGLKVTPSVGNFVLIHFADAPGRSAADADDFLIRRGVVLRRVTAYGLPNALRMTVGSAEANEATVAALAAFMGKAP